MKTYNIALFIFRLFAIALAIHLTSILLGYFLSSFNPTPLDSHINIEAWNQMRKDNLLHSAMFYGFGSVVLYFLAPVLAKLASAGARDY